MKFTEKLALTALYRLNPELGHTIAIKAIQAGLTLKPGPVTSPRLITELAGLELPNPVGLAAGFDKNATALNALLQTGFGFIEAGAATPLPQPGNAKPRLFRLREDQASINRFGFNNEGAQKIATRLATRRSAGIVGLNLGANKNSIDRVADFASVLKTCGTLVDFATVNVSSPNTEKLRDLQGKAALKALLAGVMDARESLPNHIPIFLKIAPDLSEEELADIAEVAKTSNLDGIIATNTTLSRDGLTSFDRDEMGGLSGQPLFEKSTRVLARLHTLTGGDIPLVGVGGIGSADQAYAKIRAGASAVQLYTALVYGGLSLAIDIANGLDSLLKRDGFAHVADAVGTDKAPWL